MKENLKHMFTSCGTLYDEPRTFVERSGELRWLARLLAEGLEPKGTESEQGEIVSRSRPKPGDLSMSRWKLP